MWLKERLYLSTIASDAWELAERYGLGLEIADFCTASNMDRDYETYGAPAVEKRKAASRFVFHAPFSELCPAAIDPLARELCWKRYRQAFSLAEKLGINRIVAHTGFIPQVYDPQWMVEKSVEFWREFLRELPETTEILLENVMEASPELQLKIVDGVVDPRLQLCLDIGHANVMGKDPAAWAAAFGPRLSHVHLHNNDGVQDRHWNLGEGELAIEPILEAVERANPAATFTIETQKAAPSLQFLEEKGLL